MNKVLFLGALGAVTVLGAETKMPPHLRDLPAEQQVSVIIRFVAAPSDTQIAEVRKLGLTFVKRLNLVKGAVFECRREALDAVARRDDVRSIHLDAVVNAQKREPNVKTWTPLPYL